MNQAALFYFHPSNLLSYLSLLAGLLAIVYARESNNFAVAGGLVAFSVLADLLDGRFARLFRRSEKQKAFGVQLDSLTDAIVFGVVPPVCLYPAASSATGFVYLLWIGSAFFYLLCAVTRLGVYNIHQDGVTGFVGLPTTISGLLWSSFFLLRPPITISIALMVGLSVAMVSPFAIPRPGKVVLSTIIGWAVALIILHGAWAGFRL